MFDKERIMRIILKIYASFEDIKVEHELHTMEVEDKANVILVDLGENHSYIDSKLVGIHHLRKSHIEISW